MTPALALLGSPSRRPRGAAPCSCMAAVAVALGLLQPHSVLGELGRAVAIACACSVARHAARGGRATVRAAPRARRARRARRAARRDGRRRQHLERAAPGRHAGGSAELPGRDARPGDDGLRRPVRCGRARCACSWSRGARAAASRPSCSSQPSASGSCSASSTRFPRRCRCSRVSPSAVRRGVRCSRAPPAARRARAGRSAPRSRTRGSDCAATRRDPRARRGRFARARPSRSGRAAGVRRRRRSAAPGRRSRPARATRSTWQTRARSSAFIPSITCAGPSRAEHRRAAGGGVTRGAAVAATRCAARSARSSAPWHGRSPRRGCAVRRW